MKYIIVALGLASLFLSGCWTFCESEYPQTAVMAAEGSASNLVVKVDGFETSFREYQTVHGYSMAYVPGYIGRYHYHPGYYETVSTSTYVPTVRTSDMYQHRVREALENAGFALGGTASVPDYIVEGRFGGPISESGDEALCWVWRICTVFFCDYAAENWTAQLRIRDNRTGRVVFHRSYAQRYETKVFALIPIFGIAGCDQTSSVQMQTWCLAALTDRMVADATAFFASQCPARR